MSDESTTTSYEKSVEVSFEEADRIERLIQIGDPSELLPTGETVGEYRERIRAAGRERDSAAQAEAASLRAQAAPPGGMVRMVFADSGTIAQPLAEGEEGTKKARKAGSKKAPVVKKRKVVVDESPVTAAEGAE